MTQTVMETEGETKSQCNHALHLWAMHKCETEDLAHWLVMLKKKKKNKKKTLFIPVGKLDTKDTKLGYHVFMEKTSGAPLCDKLG